MMKTNRLNLKWFSFVVVFIFLFSSCEKEDDYNQTNPSELKTVEQLSSVEKNEMIENYARVIAASMGDKELRSIIKEEALLKFDGDYDILSSTLEKRMLSNKNIQVKELLSATLSRTALQNGNLRSSRIVEGDFLESIKKVFPNLQVSVPVNCKKWDVESFIPLVVFLPYDLEEGKTDFVTAFDINGQKHKLSLDEDPAEPVIVVSVSERIDENGKRIGMEPEYMVVLPNPFDANVILRSAPAGPASLTISHGQPNSIILQWADVENETGYEVHRMIQSGGSAFVKIANTVQNDNGYVNTAIPAGQLVWYKVRAINSDGPSSWSPVMATTASSRNDGETLKVKRMKFTASALSQVEGWHRGAPELRLRVVKGSETGASYVYTSGLMEPDDRDDIKDNWWNYQFTICSWYTNTFGTVLTFDWQEEDNIKGAKITLSGSYEAKAAGGTIKAGGSVEFDVSANGAVGNTTVLWWDSKDKTYDLTGFYWQFVY